MHKVLVVDDEPFMLEGWRSMVDWHAFGYELCGAATDGEEALEAIKAYSPDLVVTDIQMPVMNGLELIRTVKEELLLPIKFIIVSGYSDFRYAKQAIRYQVDRYLLKPLVTEEIHCILKELSESIEEVHHSRMKAPLEQSAAVSAAVASLLKRGGRQAVKDAERLLQADERTDCRLILMDSDCPINPDAGDMRSNSDALDVIAAQFLKENLPMGMRISQFEKSQGGSGMLLIGSNMQELEVEACLSNMVRRLAADAYQVSVYVSEQSCGISGLQELYRQAAAVRGQHSGKRRTGVHYYRNIRFTSMKEYCFEDMSEQTAGLIRLMDENDAAGLRIAVDSIYRQIAGTAEDDEWLQVFVCQMQSLVLRRFLDAGIDAGELVNWMPVQRGDRCQDTRLWNRESLKSFCIHAAALLADQSSNKQPGTVTEVIAYIQNHYQEKLQLQDLAKRFQISPVYMGQQFKRESGYSFNDYIHKVRIDEAKKMLRRTDMKISVIAQELGYHDTDYFTGKFKTFTMQSPSSYKNKCKGERYACE